MVNQVLETKANSYPTFAGGVNTTHTSNSVCEASTAEPVATHQSSTCDSGWHFKLKIQNQELTWCMDPGAQVSEMPESVYKEPYGTLSKPDRELVGAGNVPLTTVVVALMNLAYR